MARFRAPTYVVVEFNGGNLDEVRSVAGQLGFRIELREGYFSIVHLDSCRVVSEFTHFDAGDRVVFTHDGRVCHHIGAWGADEFHQAFKEIDE